MIMGSNNMLVWQVRLWLLALAAVLVLGNTREPAAARRVQQIGSAQPVGCSVGAVQTPAAWPAGLAIAGSGVQKCRATSMTAPRGERSALAGG